MTMNEFWLGFSCGVAVTMLLGFWLGLYIAYYHLAGVKEKRQ